jgi:hypothetical protein
MYFISCAIINNEIYMSRLLFRFKTPYIIHLYVLIMSQTKVEEKSGNSTQGCLNVVYLFVDYCNLNIFVIRVYIIMIILPPILGSSSLAENSIQV